jgi:hypothetical protein
MFGGFQVGAFQPFPAYQQVTRETVSQNPGGWWNEFHTAKQLRDLERKRRAMLEDEAELATKDDIAAQEIARFLHKQQKIDAERAELERLRNLVRIMPIESVSDRARLATEVAQARDTLGAYLALERELIRQEEEEFILMATTLIAED